MDFGFAGCLPEAAPCLGMVGWAKSATNDTSVVRSAAVMNESNSVDSVAGGGVGHRALLCFALRAQVFGDSCLPDGWTAAAVPPQCQASAHNAPYVCMWCGVC
jgi:hypothetical protein